MNLLKRGAIICVNGEAPATWTEEDERGFRKSVSHFTAVRIVTQHVSQFAFNSIWLALVFQGITEIVVVKAVFDRNGKLRLCPQSIGMPIIGLN